MAEAITDVNLNQTLANNTLTLMQHLRDEYLKRRDRLVAQAAGRDGPAVEVAKALLHGYATLNGFIRFSETYLGMNPPVEVGYPRTGISLRLADSTQVLLSRQADAGAADADTAVPSLTSQLADPMTLSRTFKGKGGMQGGDGAVQVTTGEM